MQTYPQFELVIGAMSDLEGLDAVEESQRHPGNLSRMTRAVHNGQSRHHHVGVAYRLHLQDGPTWRFTGLAEVSVNTVLEIHRGYVKNPRTRSLD